MDAAILIATLGMLIFGAFVMRRLDILMKKSTQMQAAETECCDVLLFGTPTIVDPVERDLKSRGLACRRIDGDRMPEHVAFRAVIAASEDDMKNLLLCNQANHISPGAFLTAQCSNPPCRTVFIDAHVRPVLTDSPAAYVQEIGGCFHFDRQKN